ncbi:hypothetical protein BBL07_00295 [Agrobacterium vitis]|nr:hypothetical protein BBL07_00295 [Agrobacterium vitis]
MPHSSRNIKKLVCRRPSLSLRSRDAVGLARCLLTATRPHRAASTISQETKMATIGTFQQSNTNEFNGEIVTLSLQAKKVRIVPDARVSGENTPSHRVFIGRIDYA